MKEKEIRNQIDGLKRELSKILIAKIPFKPRDYVIYDDKVWQVHHHCLVSGGYHIVTRIINVANSNEIKDVLPNKIKQWNP